jgi:hypothetical protein
VQRSDYGRVSPLIMHEAIILRVKLKSAQQLLRFKAYCAAGSFFTSEVREAGAHGRNSRPCLRLRRGRRDQL